MTPLELQICLHYHGSSSDYEWIFSGAPIVGETMGQLVCSGLLERKSSIPIMAVTNYKVTHFAATPLLHAFCVLLEQTPLPISGFIDPRSGKLIDKNVTPIVGGAIKTCSAWPSA